MDAEHYLTLWKGLEVSLTSTEFLILYELAKQPGYVRSRNHLMYLAYGDEVFVDGRTVDSHIKRIRGKIRRVDPSFSHVETLYGLGYKYRAA